MTMQRNQLLKLSLLALVLSLTACGGGEERQVKYLEKAQAFLDEGNIDKARVEAKNALQINPENAEGRYLMGLVEQGEQNWRAAYGNFNKAIEIDPNHVGARIKLATLLLRARDNDKAEEHVQKVLELEPDNADAMGLMASIVGRKGDIPRAVSLANDALVKDPGNVGATAALVSIYNQTEPTKSLAIVEESLAVKPGNSALGLLKIGVLNQLGEKEAVIEEYQSMIAANKEDLFFTLGLVRFLEQEGDNAAAIAALEEGVSRHPDNIELKVGLAGRLLQNNQFDKAEGLLKTYVAESPEEFKFHHALASLYLSQGDAEKAKTVYQSVISEDDDSPQSLEARNKLIEIAMAERQPERIEALLQEIFAVEPENGDALIVRAQQKILAQDYDGAIADLRTVTKNDPESIRALLLLANAQEENGKPNLALDNFRRALTVDNNNYPALINTARLMLAQGDAEQAEPLLQSAVEKQPENIRANQLLVNALGAQQKWELALSRANRFKDHENDSIKAMGYYMDGLIQVSQEKYEKGIHALKQSLEFEPRGVESLSLILRAYAASGDQQGAVDYLNQHIEQYPDQPHPLDLLGDAYMRARNIEPAIEAYTKQLALIKNYPGLYIKLGSLYAAKGDVAKALEVFEQGLAENQNHPAILLQKATLLNINGRNDEAKAIYQTMLDEQPDSLPAANNMAMLLMSDPTAENLAEVKQLTERLKGSTVPAYLDTLGWYEYLSGNYGQAITYISSAIDLGATQPDYFYHLGMAHMKNGEPDKAREMLEKAIESGKPFADLAKAQEALEQL